MTRSRLLTLLAPPAALVAGALVTGCGSPTDKPVAADPTSTTSTTSTSSAPTSAPAPASYDVRIISATAAGGRVDLTATPLEDAGDVADFAEQFRGPVLGAQLRRVVARSDGGVLAAVVAVGCDVPPGAVAQGTGSDVTVTPEEVASPLPECLAPVTSVAVLTGG